MEILMSGELYLKNEPERIETSPVSFEEEEAFEMFVEELKNNPNVPEDFIEGMIEDHEAEKDEKEKGIPDYSGCDNFWISIIRDDGIAMVEQDSIPELGLVKKFKTKEEVDEKFIRLRVFLDKAKYVGKKFRRTKAVKTRTMTGEILMDASYRYAHSITVLYALDNIMIAVEDGPFSSKKRFLVISPRYLEDGNYEFYGEQNNEYMDKPEVYQAILQQSLPNNKKTM